jgi:CBS domain-containing protein
MRARDICTYKVITMPMDGTLIEAARLMREHHIGAVVVTELRGGLIVPAGIITDRDLVVGVLADGPETLPKLLARDIVRGEPVTAPADSEAIDVLRTMRENGIRRVPLVGQRGELVGIVSYDDLVALLADEVCALSELFTKERANERTLRPTHPDRGASEWR